MSYRFPPHGGGGVQRTAYFAHHLPAFEWDPYVLTGPLDRHSLEDSELLKLLPAGMSITRTGVLPTRDIVRGMGRLRLASVTRALTPSLPHMEAGWIAPAYRQGARLLAESDFDLIFSSAYPLASHCVAGLLARKSGIPWVADYRDEWSTRDFMRWPTPAHVGLARRIDRWIVRSADRVVTTSPAHTDILATEFAESDSSRFETITNGFSGPDFDSEPGELPDPALRGRFVLSHVGSVLTWRGADHVLEAARRLTSAGAAERLSVCFVGHAARLGAPDLQDRGLVRPYGYVSHGEAVRWMRNSTALLLINTEWANIPGKLFEYLAAGRPIIAAVREGPTADLVREHEAGVVVPPDDPEQIAAAIRALYEAWEGGRLTSPHRRAVDRYERAELTRRLAALFDAVTDGAKPQSGRQARPANHNAGAPSDS